MIVRRNQLEKQFSSLRIPVAYANMVYMLRTTLAMMREALQKACDKRFPICVTGG
jgi:hypothetical protein